MNTTAATATNSYPAVTLANPRHEAFALALAQGAAPEAAYRAAGFSDNNRKARARDLADDPDIAARVAHLRACLPHIDALRDRFAPSLLLMPQTQDEMKAWLWQVMNGTRRILPLQFRAANLFCRLNGWHIVPKTQLNESAAHAKPNSKPTPLLDQERQMLDHLNRLTTNADLSHRPLPSEQVALFYSVMADTALLSQATAEATTEAATATAPEPAPATPATPATVTAPAVPTKSPSISLQPQPVSSPQSPNGDKNATSSPTERTVDTPVGITAHPGASSAPPKPANPIASSPHPTHRAA